MPAVLATNGEAWRDQYLEAIRSGVGHKGAVAERYKHRDVREALRQETREKCAYCESKIRHVAPDHIEHIKPKSRHPELFCEWTNLTIGCPVCNGLKGDYDSDTDPLINPYVDEPSDHLAFVGALVLGKPHSRRGGITARRLELSRPELVERRSDRIKRLHPLVERWAMEEEIGVKDLLAKEIRREAEEAAEFSATIRAYLAAIGFDV